MMRRCETLMTLLVLQAVQAVALQLFVAAFGLVADSGTSVFSCLGHTLQWESICDISTAEEVRKS